MRRSMQSLKLIIAAALLLLTRLRRLLARRRPRRRQRHHAVGLAARCRRAAHAGRRRPRPRRGQSAVAPAADRGQRRADRAPQQSRASGRLQRARFVRSRDGAGEPAAQPDLLGGAHRGPRRRPRDRKPRRRQPARSSRRCRLAPRSRPIDSARRNCRRRTKPCASRAKRAAPFIARSRRARWSRFSRRRARPARPRRSLRSASARPAP